MAAHRALDKVCSRAMSSKEMHESQPPVARAADTLKKTCWVCRIDWSAVVRRAHHRQYQWMASHRGKKPMKNSSVTM